MARLSTRLTGRRLKSAKAGNRGVWGTEGATGAMGIWRRGECWGSCVDAGDRIALARILGVGAGANERVARCSRGFAVRSRGNLADRSKRVVPGESRPEWRASVRYWISDDGIMRCRS